MKTRKKKLTVLLILMALMVLSSLTLTRCGAGVGPGFDTDLNGMKY